jgi:hypothetical protein
MRMPSNQLAVVSHHAGHDPAELRHAGGDLRHLVVPMHLGVPGIGVQPIERPGFNLAWRKDEVHGAAL